MAKKTTFKKFETGDFIITPELVEKFDNFEIHAGKLKDKTSLTASFSQKTDWGTWPSGSMDYPDIVHDDLKNAFNELNVHFAIISEQIVLPKDEIGEFIVVTLNDLMQDGYNLRIVEAMSVTGFKISGSGSNEGVSLTGTKILSNGKVLNLSTPVEKWEDEQHQYPYADELSQVIEKCKYEMLLFMHGKHAPEKQQALDLQVPEEMQPEEMPG